MSSLRSKASLSMMEFVVRCALLFLNVYTFSVIIDIKFYSTITVC